MPHISLIQAGQGNLSRKGVKMDDSYIEEGLEGSSEYFESGMESEETIENIENDPIQEDSDALGESIDSPGTAESS